MKIDQVEALVQALCMSSLNSLEYEGDGATLRVSFSRRGPLAQAAASQMDSSTGIHTSVRKDSSRSVTIDARNTGTLWIRHPLATSAAVSIGTSVTKGQVVAFLQIGDVLSAVISSADGTVANQLVDEGTLVGYGQSIFTLA